MTPLLRLLQTLVAATDEPPVLRISDRFPDVALTNQFGRAIRFRRDFIASGQALVVNTMFTTCRGSCSVTSARIRQLRTELAPVFGRTLSFVSLTLEPRVDEPAVLRKYAERYGAATDDEKLPSWHFLTGGVDDLDALRRSLGFFDLDPKVDRDITRHANALLVGNALKDRWSTIPAELKTSTLVETIRRVGGFTYEQRYGLAG